MGAIAFLETSNSFTKMEDDYSAVVKAEKKTKPNLVIKWQVMQKSLICERPRVFIVTLRIKAQADKRRPLNLPIKFVKTHFSANISTL